MHRVVGQVGFGRVVFVVEVSFWSSIFWPAVFWVGVCLGWTYLGRIDNVIGGGRTYTCKDFMALPL